jgi:hypothetical protein
MNVMVWMNEAGMVWIENSQGHILAECFFKTDSGVVIVALFVGSL